MGKNVLRVEVILKIQSQEWQNPRCLTVGLWTRVMLECAPVQSVQDRVAEGTQS